MYVELKKVVPMYSERVPTHPVISYMRIIYLIVKTVVELIMEIKISWKN